VSKGKRCRHENATGYMWREATHGMSILGITHQWFHAFVQPGDPAHHYRIACSDCGHWLSLGESNDAGPEVAIEVRAAELAASNELPKCNDGALEERCVRCGWENWIADNAAPSDDWHAGNLARCIASHDALNAKAGGVVIAALFVQSNGSYYGLPDVDPWDITRDARLYPGPHPVVAHPPCQLWVNFAALNFARYGGEHNRPGNDNGCFASALASVRAWGGVLEHPAGSRAFPAHDIPSPHGLGWQATMRRDEYVCEVWQSAYGHRARKRTWLLYVGAPPVELKWIARPGEAQVGWFDRIKPTLSKREASATPVEFRDALIGLAREARKPQAAIDAFNAKAGEL
jgi:hypothetical protein